MSPSCRIFFYLFASLWVMTLSKEGAQVAFFFKTGFDQLHVFYLLTKLFCFLTHKTLHKVICYKFFFNWIRIRIKKEAGFGNGSALRRTAGSGSGSSKKWMRIHIPQPWKKSREASKTVSLSISFRHHIQHEYYSKNSPINKRLTLLQC